MAGVKVMLDPPRYAVPAETRPDTRKSTAPVTVVNSPTISDRSARESVRLSRRFRRSTATKFASSLRIFRPNHAEAFKAAEAAHCAGDQSKYWEMHDAMFVDIAQARRASAEANGAGLGIDGDAFDQCLDSGTYTAIVREDYELGQKMGVNSTPMFYVNGRALIGAQPFDAFKQIIDVKGAGARRKGESPDAGDSRARNSVVPTSSSSKPFRSDRRPRTGPRSRACDRGQSLRYLHACRWLRHQAGSSVHAGRRCGRCDRSSWRRGDALENW